MITLQKHQIERYHKIHHITKQQLYFAPCFPIFCPLYCTFLTSCCRRWYFSYYYFNFTLRTYSFSTVSCSLAFRRAYIYFYCSFLVFLNRGKHTLELKSCSRVPNRPCFEYVSSQLIGSLASITTGSIIWLPSPSARCRPWLLLNHNQQVGVYFQPAALSCPPGLWVLFLTAVSGKMALLVGFWTSVVPRVFSW